jgi:hypothetical protein
MLVLGSGGLGCGEGVRPEPEPATGAPVQESEDDSPAGDAEEAPEVSAAWSSPSTSCAGLVPPAPGAGRFVNRDRESEACLPGTSDGKGDLALGIFSTLFDAARWTAFTPEGLPRDTFNGGVGNLLMPQKSGFHLVSIAFGSDIVRLQAVSRTGAPLTSRVLIDPNTAPGSHWSAAEDPRGGSVVAWVRFGALPGPWQVVVQRFGSSGEPRTPPLTVHAGTGDVPSFTEVGADTQGRVLVLWEASGGLRGRWLRRNETFTSEFPVLATAVGPTSPIIGQQGKLLSPLIGGGFALEQGEAWVAVIRSKQTSVEPAPGWLVARPGTELVIIRCGRGYALVSRGTGGFGDSRLEVLAPAGNSCGDVPLPDLGTLREVRVGRDGTVIAEAPEAEDNVCTYRYWPRLLH